MRRRRRLRLSLLGAALVTLLASCGTSTPVTRGITTTSGVNSNTQHSTTTTAAPTTTTSSPTTTTAAPTTTTAAQPMFIPLAGISSPLYQPSQFSFTADGTGYVDGITWSSWGPGGAMGTGTLHINDCIPDCASGTSTPYPATVSLSGASQTSSGYIFTSMTIDSPTAPGGSETYAIPR